jgi:hypothetical protein
MPSELPVVKVRMTDDEVTAIDEVRGRVSRSEWLRRLAVNEIRTVRGLDGPGPRKRVSTSITQRHPTDGSSFGPRWRPPGGKPLKCRVL